MVIFLVVLAPYAVRFAGRRMDRFVANEEEKRASRETEREKDAAAAPASQAKGSEVRTSERITAGDPPMSSLSQQAQRAALAASAPPPDIFGILSRTKLRQSMQHLDESGSNEMPDAQSQQMLEQLAQMAGSPDTGGALQQSGLGAGMNPEQLMASLGLSPYEQLLSPTSGSATTSDFGMRKDPFTSQEKKHSGIDFAETPDGNAIAIADGTVLSAGPRGGYGIAVEVAHSKAITSLYAHLDRAFVSAGEHVSSGQPVGKIGSTGHATGEHLHYELRVNGVAQRPEIVMLLLSILGKEGSGQGLSPELPPDVPSGRTKEPVNQEQQEIEPQPQIGTVQTVG